MFDITRLDTDTYAVGGCRIRRHPQHKWGVWPAGDRPNTRPMFTADTLDEMFDKVDSARRMMAPLDDSDLMEL